MGLDLGELGFWLFLAAVVVSFVIAGAMKHNAMLKLIAASIEKTGTVDPKLAEMLEKEIERKAQADAWAWGRPTPGAAPETPRKVVSGLIGVAGGFLGFIAFAANMGEGSVADRGVLMSILTGVGVGAAIASVFGLVAWLIWPKSKKSSDSEPLV